MANKPLGIYVERGDDKAPGRLYAIKTYEAVPAGAQWGGSTAHHRFVLSPEQASELVRGVCQYLTAEELRGLLRL